MNTTEKLSAAMNDSSVQTKHLQASSWPECIITAYDLIGTSGLPASVSGSAAMIQMHNLAEAKINHGLPLHSHGYVWNDSVLLLSYRTELQVRQALFAELGEFKSFLEETCGVPMYAISVKGLAFPQHTGAFDSQIGQFTEQPRAVILKTSSWAMANCFLIEKKLGRLRADWYIDSRITKGANLPSPFASRRIELFPKKERRTIHMFKGHIHATR
jgi:hypothetical protein